MQSPTPASHVASRLIACLLLLLLAGSDASAYIGPGAGFALGGSMLVLLVTFALAFAIILTWPLRLLYRLLTVGNPYKNASAKKVVIIQTHTNKAGESKVLKECRLPLTGVGCVDRLITELAVFDFEGRQMVLHEIAPGTSIDDLRKVTEADFLVGEVTEMVI